MANLNDRNISFYMAVQTRINAEVLAALVEIIKLTRENGNSALIERVEKVLEHVGNQARLIRHIDTDSIIGMVNGDLPADLVEIIAQNNEKVTDGKPQP